MRIKKVLLNEVVDFIKIPTYSQILKRIMNK